MNPGRYTRTCSHLDTIRALLSRGLHGDYIEAELDSPVMGDALAALADSLGLPDGWGIGELDQRIAELKDEALQQLEVPGG